MQQTPSYKPYADSTPLSVGQYFGMLILLLIPIVNIIMIFVWAFGNSNLNKRNFARAYLIIALILIVISIVLTIMFGSLLASLYTFDASLGGM